MYVVILSGEDIADSEIYGPFRSEQIANEVADAWTDAHPGDPAIVRPILHRATMDSSW